MGGSATQIGLLVRRQVKRTVSQPASLVSTIVFPLFLLAVNSGGLRGATDLPGFPTDSYITFLFGFTFVQAALFATAVAGTTLAEDIRSGFFNRLILSPIGRTPLVLGLLGGVIALSFIQAAVYLVVGVLAGVSVAGGVGAVPVIMVLAILTGLAFGGFGLFIALRTGSGEAVQGAFPIMFVFLFLSSMLMPRALIEHEWFRTIATWNPVSYLIEGFRSLLITGWDGHALLAGFAVACGLFAASFFAAVRALDRRMERT